MSRPISILLVDDDASGRTVLGISLRQAGLDVQTASSGEEALALIKTRRFDWLITDGKMAHMDGFELARRAKELDPRLHVAMVSAVYDASDAEGHSVEGFFPKPVALESLVSFLRR